MPIEIKVILLFGVLWVAHESIKLYIKRIVLEIINDKKSNYNQ